MFEVSLCTCTPYVAHAACVAHYCGHRDFCFTLYRLLFSDVTVAHVKDDSVTHISFFSALCFGWEVITVSHENYMKRVPTLCGEKFIINV